MLKKIKTCSASTAKSQRSKNQGGFTLIEVLLALAIIAIAFTALLQATSTNIVGMRRLTEKTIAHWTAVQGIKMIQLGLISPTVQEKSTQVTTLFGQKTYWRAQIVPTAFHAVDQITITVSQKQTGPFINPLIGYRYAQPYPKL